MLRNDIDLRFTQKNKNKMHKITASHATNIAMHIFDCISANTGECDFQTFCSRQNIMKLNYTVETRQRARYSGGFLQIIAHTILEPQVIMCNTRSFMANIKFTKKKKKIKNEKSEKIIFVWLLFENVLHDDDDGH